LTIPANRDTSTLKANEVPHEGAGTRAALALAPPPPHSALALRTRTLVETGVRRGRLGGTGMQRTDATALLTAPELARRLNVSLHTVLSWRLNGLGPPFIRLTNRSVRYRLADVDRWLRRRAKATTNPTADGSAA
jgi:predicted DNA-binding transcriptional regulator AlpA